VTSAQVRLEVLVSQDFASKFVEICGSITAILPAVEMSNTFRVSRVTPPVELNEKIQYSETKAKRKNQNLDPYWCKLTGRKIAIFWPYGTVTGMPH
jgi:hypothetical protein